MATFIKATTWTVDGAIKMPPSKRAEIDAFYKKYADRNIELRVSLLPKRSTQSNRYYRGIGIFYLQPAPMQIGCDRLGI